MGARSGIFRGLRRPHTRREIAGLATITIPSPGARPAISRSLHECPVAAPYRLDLTVSVLRRLSTNVVDVLTPDGQYARVLGASPRPVVARVAQVGPQMLTITIDGDEREHGRALALVRRMLGV